MGELVLAWGGGGLTKFGFVLDSRNLTRDLSRYVRIPLRNPLDPGIPFSIILKNIMYGIGYSIAYWALFNNASKHL